MTVEYYHCMRVQQCYCYCAKEQINILQGILKMGPPQTKNITLKQHQIWNRYIKSNLLLLFAKFGQVWAMGF